LTSVLFGQQLYTVQVGTFLEVRSQDFDELRPLGFIYGNQLEGNLTQVFLGNYSDLSKAETVTNQLRARGFKNAQVLQRPIDAGQSVVVIQLTTQTNGSKIDWAGLDRAGELFVENDDQLLRS
ncbi:MAG: SPOR domain-containing protein, partial [Bacteroidota bacterium]